MTTEETCTHGATPLMCDECTAALVLADPIARQAYLENRDARRIKEVADWLRSADAGALYGSESWALRRRIAEALERGTHKSWRSRVDSR
jgi:hypothetical protein